MSLAETGDQLSITKSRDSRSPGVKRAGSDQLFPWRPSLLRTQLAHEWTLQSRSYRFRIGLLLYLVFATLGPISLALSESGAQVSLSPISGLVEAFRLLPFTTILFTLVVVGNTARVDGRSTILVSAPTSNAGFVLRKLVAQITIVLLATLLATAAATLAASWQDLTRLPIQQASSSWLVVLVPRVLIAASGWLGANLFLRSEIASFFAAAVGLNIAQSALNQLLFRTGVVLTEFQWTDFENLSRWGVVQVRALTEQYYGMAFQAASETDFPISLAWQQLSTRLLLPAAAAAMVLAVGIGYLDRCRADVSPSRLGPLHPLRNFGLRYRRLRDSLRSDSGLALSDRVIRVILFLIGLGLLGYGFQRGYVWQETLEERYQTLIGHYQTTPLEVQPAKLTLAGSIRSRTVDLSGTTTLVNRGEEPVANLAFELDRHLDLTRLEAESRTLRYERTWDRLLVALEPPIGPGDSAVLSFAITGEPAEDVPRVRYMSGDSTVESWERHRRARYPRERSPLLHSRTRSLISANRTLLPSKSLFPVPRFETWELTDNSQSFSENPRDVPEETHRTTSTIVLDLEVPEEWILADSCGHTNPPGRTKLESTCHQDLIGFSLAGGRRVLTQGRGGRVRFATLPRHAGLAERAMLSMERVFDLSSQITSLLPSANAADTTKARTTITALEMPAPFDLDRAVRIWERSPPDVETLGQLIVVPESRLLDREPIAAPELVASVLLHRLRPKKIMAAADERAFLSLYRTLLLNRMGSEEEKGAAITIEPWYAWRLRRSLLEVGSFDRVIWQHKAPALLRDLEARVGRQNVFSAFQDFLVDQEPGIPSTDSIQPDSDEPATLRDLFRRLEELSGVDLDPFYDDFVDGGALPLLQLIDVVTVQDRDRFIVRGLVSHRGAGLARCELQVKTDQEVFSQILEIQPRNTTPFEFEVRERPYTLVLDPNLECYRFRPLNHSDTVNLGSIAAAG